MKRYLLDTNVFITLLKNGSPTLNRRVRQWRRTDIGLSAIALHELYYGAFKSRFQADSLQRVTEIGFLVVPFDAEDARLAGEIRAVLTQAGSPIGPYDTLFAGQALYRNLILVTANLREFRRIQNLINEDWGPVQSWPLPLSHDDSALSQDPFQLLHFGR